MPARFHVPAAMLGRILGESDPVGTSSENRLRFEGFFGMLRCSGASGSNARSVDRLNPMGRGITNVDFNQPMLNELARIRDDDAVSLVVDANQVILSGSTKNLTQGAQLLKVQSRRQAVDIMNQAIEHRIQRLQAWQAFT